jgi:polysaccharide biosynthesis protein PslH
MDLLFISARTPKPGDPRTFHLIRALAARKHRITLVCGATRSDATHLAQLGRLCRTIYDVPLPAQARLRSTLRMVPTALPMGASSVLNPTFVAAVQAAARATPNAVAHLAGIAVAPLSVALRGLPAVIDLAGCASTQHLRTLMRPASLRDRVAALIELGRTRRYEAQLGAQFERLIVASADDAWAIRTLTDALGGEAHAPISVITDGIDLEHYAPEPAFREPNMLVLSNLPAAYADQAVRFIGTDVMPRIWRARADVTLTLVGVPVVPAVRALIDDPRVTLLPSNADVRPSLARATLACVPPLPAPGLPMSGLTALAMGTPVVAAVQAARGTHLSDGHDLLLANDGATFAHAILALLDDPAYRGRLGRAGRRYVEQQHDWDAAAAQAEQIYAAAMGVEIADWRLAMGMHQRLAAADLR